MIGELIKNKGFRIIVALAGITAISLTIYDSILSIKLNNIKLKELGHVDEK